MQPNHAGCLPASSALRPAWVERCVTTAATLCNNTSRANVDLPEPETPVTATNRFNGTSTLTSFKLCRDAPSKESHFEMEPSSFEETPRLACTGCRIACNKYFPVCESLTEVMSLTAPWPIKRPPRLPALGPMSMMWSARRIVSSSCSTTTKVLPLLLSKCKAFNKIWLSRACRPIVGSSKT